VDAGLVGSFDVGVVAQGLAGCGAEQGEFLCACVILGGAVCAGRVGGFRSGRQDGGKSRFDIKDSVEVVHGGVVAGVHEDLAQPGLDVEDVVQRVGQGVLVLGEPVVHGLVEMVVCSVVAHCSSSRALR
jgi:hypothetical protein